MATLTGKTISEFPNLSSASDSDIFPVKSESATKKITFANLISSIKTAIKLNLSSDGARISESGSGAIIVQRPYVSGASVQFAFDSDGSMSYRSTSDSGETWTSWKTFAVADYCVVDSTTASSATEISAGATSGAIQIPCAKTGYVPIGIVGITKSGTASSYCLPYEFRVNGNNAILYFRNMGTSDASITATAYVLYRRNV